MNELGHGPWEKGYEPSGISRAESRAWEAYPYDSGMKGLICENSRQLFVQGYEAAEKDLALTWEDMREITRIDIEMMDDPEEHPEWMEEQSFYEEVLRRFMQIKEAKK